MGRVRIEVDGGRSLGTPEGEAIQLEDGSTVAAEGARYLAPVAPSKIVATHLSYRSRCDEYRMARPPAAPSYFLKPPSSLSAHGAAVARPRGCRFLNYEGEIAVVIGERCAGCRRGDALDHVARLHGRQRLRRPRLPPRRPRLDAARQGPGRLLPAGPGAGRRRRRRPRRPDAAHVRQRRAGRRRATRAPTCCSRSPTRSPTSRG